jgi:hypothetical protein
MARLLIWFGWIAGIGGILVCLVSAAVRLSGTFTLGRFELGTLLHVGTAAMILGCFCLLAALTIKLPTSY